MKNILNYFLCERNDLLVIPWLLLGVGLFLSYLYFGIDDYYALIMVFGYFVITMNFKNWCEKYCSTIKE